MSVVTARYTRKPLVVNGVQVTEENFADVAKWCDGVIHWIEDGSELFKNGSVNGTIDPKSAEDPIHPLKQFIKINVINPRSPRQSKAYVGDWILRTNSGCKVYTNKAFTNNFVPCEEEATDVRHSNHS